MGFLKKILKKEPEKKIVQNDKETLIEKSRWFTLDYQREVLKKISNIIPTVLLGGMLMCNDHALEKVDENDPHGPNSILNGVGGVAFDLNSTLGITNFDMADEIFGNKPKEELKFCSDALKEYAAMLKPELSSNIQNTIRIIEKYL